MKVLICGDRNWNDAYVILNCINKLTDKYNNNLTIIAGGARGADKIAAQWCKTLGINLIEVHADWKKYGKSAGPIRNKIMLDMNPDLLIAFHNDIENSKGTKHCKEEAEKRGISVEIISIIK